MTAMKVELVTLAVLMAVLSGAQAGRALLRDPVVVRGVREAAYEYRTEYFEQVLDHFSFSNEGKSFQQKILVNDTWWKKGSDGKCGPIFFYTGNEGAIELFAQNTGFVWETAPMFNALVVFAEHRYYGSSLPFGKDTYKHHEQLAWLTSEQALADYAVLLKALKEKLGCEHSAVIAFGGSYGGMLASWFRLKYPNVVDGAIAASAPVLQFTAKKAERFNAIASDDFWKASKACGDNIQASWGEIRSRTSMEELKKLRDIFGICDELTKPEDTEAVVNWLYNGLTYLAMVDYPYEANFLEPMPAWPVKAACASLSERVSGDALLEGVKKAVSVYFNSTGDVQCFKLGVDGSSQLGDDGWDYQACTEMVMPMASNGKDDIFWDAPWNYTAYAEGCQKKWGTTPRPNWIYENFGNELTLEGSNIVYSNGELDPWRGGGVTKSISESLVALYVAEGAHHLDLRAANPRDPPSVREVREIERQHIGRWIREAEARHRHEQ